MRYLTSSAQLSSIQSFRTLILISIFGIHRFCAEISCCVGGHGVGSGGKVKPITSKIMMDEQTCLFHPRCCLKSSIILYFNIKLDEPNFSLITPVSTYSLLFSTCICELICSAAYAGELTCWNVPSVAKVLLAKWNQYQLMGLWLCTQHHGDIFV